MMNHKNTDRIFFFSEMKAKKFSLLFIYVIWVVSNMF